MVKIFINKSIACEDYLTKPQLYTSFRLRFLRLVPRVARVVLYALARPFAPALSRFAKSRVDSFFYLGLIGKNYRKISKGHTSRHVFFEGGKTREFRGGVIGVIW